MTYFKKTHPFLQILIFTGIAIGCFLIFSFIGSLILLQISGLSLGQISDPDNWDYSNPQMLIFLRGLLVIQFLSLFVIPVFLYARLADTNPTEYLGLRSARPMYFILGIVVLIGALPLVDWAGT